MIDVVVVDDDVNVRRGLQKVVKWEELGARLAMVCKNGQEVVEYLRSHVADVVISDVKMPLMDGLMLSKYISETSPDTVVILLSAYQEFGLLQEALEYGVRRYILKPINKEKVKLLSEIVLDVSEEKEQKQKLTNLMYNSDFSGMVKKAFFEKNLTVLDSVLTLNKHFKKTKSNLVREYYVFIFNILNEFAHEINQEHLLGETFVGDFNKCVSEAEFKSFLLDNYEKIMRSSGASVGQKEKVSAEEIKNYIDAHFAEKGFSTFDLSKKFNLSASYLSTQFKKSEGSTIVDYITRKKIDKACSLIRETSLSIKYIASLVGYEDIQYFSKVFKNIMNMSPSDYLLRYRTGGGEL